MKRIYMAGSGGMLGSSFYHVFRSDFELRCTDIDVNDSWLSYLDFRDFKAYRNDVLAFNPDYLFHLGALTDLEFCELNLRDTYLTNTLSVEHAALIANELDIPLLYISTAGIFNGEKDVYDDWDIPCPLGHYAKSKYAGEVYVKENVRKHMICRAGWMMGGGPGKDKKLIQKIMSQIKNGSREIFIVNDKFGTPTYTVDFANNVKLLLSSEIWGLYNMACSGLTSRIDVITELITILGLVNKVNIIEVSSEYFNSNYFAIRPNSERLINYKLDLRNLNIMRDWRLCLSEYIHNYYQSYLPSSLL